MNARRAPALLALGLVLTGCSSATTGSTTSPPSTSAAETQQATSDAQRRRDIYESGKAECRYLHYGSHWSYERALRTIRRDFTGPMRDAAIEGCLTGY